LGGGGGGRQLGFGDDIGAGVEETRRPGGGDDSGRALARAAAAVPFGGETFACDDDEGDDGEGDCACAGDCADDGDCAGDGDCADDRDCADVELAIAAVPRCAVVFARGGNGGGFAAPARLEAGGALTPRRGSEGGRGALSTAAFTVAVAIASGVGTCIRVESMRTAAMSVESFASE
jgi:hypothetical protein